MFSVRYIQILYMLLFDHISVQLSILLIDFDKLDIYILYYLLRLLVAIVNQKTILLLTRNRNYRSSLFAFDFGYYNFRQIVNRKFVLKNIK